MNTDQMRPEPMTETPNVTFLLIESESLTFPHPHRPSPELFFEQCHFVADFIQCPVVGYFLEAAIVQTF